MMNQRIHEVYRPVEQRRRDFKEVERPLSAGELKDQADRCMNCGVPFCHGTGCPLGNVMPEINMAVARGNWEEAWEILSSTGFFPEFTGRICPALCEGACTDGIDGDPVMIRQLEKAVVEKAFELGLVRPPFPLTGRSGKTVAVVGSGPAGLAAATALNLMGHTVTVFEEQKEIGGLLRYGIPDFKLEKRIIERRKALMEEAGISFRCATSIGKDISGAYLRRNFDAVVLAVGAQHPRDLAVPGRDLAGIYFALEFLQGQNRVIGGECETLPVSAAGKRVVVIGGGDTASDCVGTAIRQGATSVVQLEIMPKPPETRAFFTPWPEWPYLLRTSSSHQEDGERRWGIATKRFTGENGHVTGIEVAQVKWEFTPLGRPLRFTELDGTIEVIPAELVLLAMGFDGVAGDAGVEIGKNVFAAGDCATGASLVVRAIAEGKRVAETIDQAWKDQTI